MKTFKITIRILLLMIIATFILISCTDGKDEGAIAIESYIKALSDKDPNQISNLSCSEWEQNALIEMDSLTAVDSKVEELSCEKTGQEGNDAYIDCTGIIALDYGGEAQEIDLSTRTYIARQEGGEWRMCGYRQ